ncbi:MAG: DUF1772 domain-containing protein [Saccharospirillaceae bacterium]|nr:DUF1772 domain-containing protein [Saccharospirillaceae bacterium]MCD8529808.1 DUF1772 domain-containing protein [Saccharospirillaceae bacterium]
MNLITERPQELILALTLWGLALSAGIMAGVYFAFSAFVISSLDKLDSNRAAAAMNSINRVIVTSAFMPLFWGSSLLAVMLIVFTGWQDSVMLATLAGVVYLAGMLLVTILFNVPLNNRLRDCREQECADVWLVYKRRWTSWNHVRTVASLLTMLMCICLLSDM